MAQVDSMRSENAFSRDADRGVAARANGMDESKFAYQNVPTRIIDLLFESAGVGPRIFANMRI